MPSFRPKTLLLCICGFKSNGKLRKVVERTVRIRKLSLIDSLLFLLGLSVWVGKGLNLGLVTVRPVDIVSVLLVMALLAQLALLPGNSLRKHGNGGELVAALLIPILLVVGTSVVSAVNAVELAAVFRFAARYLLGAVLIGGLSVFLFTHNRIRLLAHSLLIGAVASVVVSAVAIVLPPLAAFTIRYGDRAQALLNHPNQFAMLLVSVIPLALALALKRHRRIGAWLVLAVLVTGVGLSGSKANLVLGVVALALTSLLASQLHRRITRRVGLAIGLTVGTVCFGYLAFLTVETVNPRTLATIERLLQEPEQVTAVITRVEMWETAIDLGLQYPWTGIGAGNAIHYLPYDHAHNVFIEFFMTLGVPGVLALALLLLSIFVLVCVTLWYAITARSVPFTEKLLSVALPVGVLSYVLANQSSDSFGGTTLPILWVLTSMLLAQLRLIWKQRANYGGSRADVSPFEAVP